MNMNTVFMNMNILYARGGGRMSQCTSPCMQHAMCGWLVVCVSPLWSHRMGVLRSVLHGTAPPKVRPHLKGLQGWRVIDTQ